MVQGRKKVVNTSKAKFFNIMSKLINTTGQDIVQDDKEPNTDPGTYLHNIYTNSWQSLEYIYLQPDLQATLNLPGGKPKSHCENSNNVL